jgi:hypothetical protein
VTSKNKQICIFAVRGLAYLDRAERWSWIGGRASRGQDVASRSEAWNARDDCGGRKAGVENDYRERDSRTIRDRVLSALEFRDRRTLGFRLAFLLPWTEQLEQESLGFGCSSDGIPTSKGVLNAVDLGLGIGLGDLG